MAPVVSEESILLLLVLLLPFGHLVELVLGLPKDIVEISIREIVLQREERARRGQLWLLQRLGHLRRLCPSLTAPVLTPTAANSSCPCQISWRTHTGTAAGQSCWPSCGSALWLWLLPFARRAAGTRHSSGTGCGEQRESPRGVPPFSLPGLSYRLGQNPGADQNPEMCHSSLSRDRIC